MRDGGICGAEGEGAVVVFGDADSVEGGGFGFEFCVSFKLEVFSGQRTGSGDLDGAKGSAVVQQVANQDIVGDGWEVLGVKVGNIVKLVWVDEEAGGVGSEDAGGQVCNPMVGDGVWGN